MEETQLLDETGSPNVPELKVIVFGAAGMLGQDLVEELRSRGHEVTALDKSEFDVTLMNDLDKLKKRDFGNVNWYINCSAYTDVDGAESNLMAAMKLNAIAPASLAMIAKEVDAHYLHISTDFVFDGESEFPYTETSHPNPINAYGKSKREGEKNVMLQNEEALIFRTSWLYGIHGKCFPRTMIKAFTEGKDLKVVNDQTGCPTFTKDLARVMGDAIESNLKPGLYHTTGPDAITWHEFATKTISAWCALKDIPEPKIEKISYKEFSRPAKPPNFSVLSNEKIIATGIAPMRSCDDSLNEFVALLDLELKLEAKRI